MGTTTAPRPVHPKDAVLLARIDAILAEYERTTDVATPEKVLRSPSRGRPWSRNTPYPPLRARARRELRDTRLADAPSSSPTPLAPARTPSGTAITRRGRHSQTSTCRRVMFPSCDVRDRLDRCQRHDIAASGRPVVTS